eukprot:4438371-Amphidinium_carterae.1
MHPSSVPVRYSEKLRTRTQTTPNFGFEYNTCGGKSYVIGAVVRLVQCHMFCFASLHSHDIPVVHNHTGSCKGNPVRRLLW